MLRRLAFALTLAFATALHAESAMCPQLDPGILSDSPLDKLVLTADALDLDKGGFSDFAGKVRLRLGGREFTGESLRYDEERRQVSITTPSRFRNDLLLIDSQAARYDLDTETGVFESTSFTLISRGARGEAQSIALAKIGTATLKGVSYTSCSPGDEAWRITAGSIHLDQNRGLGQARDATVRFSGVPILYLPYLQFPIDDARHSGLLFPSFGSNNRTGLDFSAPLYLNLAPNYDAILTPRILGNRGVQMGLSGRYLLAQSTGRANFEYMPNDQQTGESRGLSEVFHLGLLNRRLALAVHYAEVSDPRYYEDLSGRSVFSTLTHLERSVRLTYQAPASYTLQALVQDFQPLASQLAAVDDPYRRLPELRLDSLSAREFLGLRYGLTAQATNFARKGSVQGLREVLQPKLQFSRDRGAFYTGAEFDLSHTQYQLNNTGSSQSDFTRTLPILSAETGLRFEKFTGDELQLLEPKLYYLYVPYRDQSQLPLFDSGEPDYDFPQLFARNRYSGYDRIADANQLTTAVSWRRLDAATGATKFSASFGQLYRFANSRVQLRPGDPTPDSGGSAYLGGLDLRLSPRLSLAANAQFSPDDGRFERTGMALRYRNGGQRADLAYRFRSGLLEQADASFSLPISTAWRAALRLRESIRDQRLLDTLLGLEYETCCWAARGSYRRFLVNSAGQFDSGFYLQLELKGLTRLGSGFDNLLPGDDRPLGDD